MYQRIEQKLELKKCDYLSFVKWIKRKNVNFLYPERIVCSRYYDTYNYKMLRDTIEGILPRKKLRIRTYGSYFFEKSENQYNLEIKFNKDNKRFKEIIENVDLSIFSKDPYYLKGYGFCYPCIDIAYRREYFSIDGIRLTIDSNIFYKYKSIIDTIKPKESYDENFVVEIKAGMNNNSKFLIKEFNFFNTKFSKYERGMCKFLTL